MDEEKNPGETDFVFDEMPGEEMHRRLREYREQGEVQPTRFMGLPAFVITGHEALTEAFMDNETFPPHRMYQASFEGAIGESFISMEDPGRHRLYRKLATPAFRSRAVSRYEREDLAALAHELIDRLAGLKTFDLVEAFTARFPYLVISRLLGLPRDREDEFQDWAFALLQFRDDPATAAVARKSLTDFLAPVVEDRRRAPREDVISELVGVRVDGRKLEDEEIHSHIRLLFPTGGETTHGALGNLLSAALRLPEIWDALRSQPSLAGAAVQESLRWETPIAVLPRLSAPTERQFRGIRMPADSWVLFAMAAANRDPSVFPNPDRFDIARFEPGPSNSAPSINESLTFGRGVKACPGMHLARKNMEIALQVLLERLPSLELIDHDAALPRRTVLRCPAALRVRV
jgi:cytochrome P450